MVLGRRPPVLWGNIPQGTGSPWLAPVEPPHVDPPPADPVPVDPAPVDPTPPPADPAPPAPAPVDPTPPVDPTFQPVHDD